MFKKVFSNSSLRYKVSFTVFAVVLIAILCISFLTGEIYSNSLMNTTSESAARLLEQSNKNISYYIDGMLNIANIANKQFDILSFLFMNSQVDADYSKYYQAMFSVRTFLIDLMNMRPDVSCITIKSFRSGLTTSTALITKLDTFDPVDDSTIEEAKNNPGKPIFLSPRNVNYIDDSLNPVITMVQTINMYPGGESLGIIIIDLDNKTIGSICADIHIGKKDYSYIIDSAGNYIYKPDSEDSSFSSNLPPEDAYKGMINKGGSSFVALNARGSKNLITGTPVDSTNWSIINVIPYEEIATPANAIKFLQMVIGLLAAIFIASLLIKQIGSIILNRLTVLQSEMFKAQSGILTVRYQDDLSDEISQLGDSFNTMINRIGKLMDRNVQTEKEKHKAELAVLQSQINPHFLYNTLDAIVWMAQFKQEGAAEMAEALARFFRLTLSQGEDIIPLSQELSHADTYLCIQQIRYKSYFDYSIKCESKINNLLVPKMIVQPLVENAIYHGIKMSRRKCRLLINAFEDGDDIVIQIIDDGIGMTEEISKRILTERLSQKPMGGVGVRNVNERIKLYYSNYYGINYYSVKSVGTLAEIRLAKQIAHC